MSIGFNPANITPARTQQAGNNKLGFGCSKCDLGKESVELLKKAGVTEKAAKNILDAVAPAGKQQLTKASVGGTFEIPVHHDTVVKSYNNYLKDNAGEVAKSIQA